MTQCRRSRSIRRPTRIEPTRDDLLGLVRYLTGEDNQRLAYLREHLGELPGGVSAQVRRWLGEDESSG